MFGDSLRSSPSNHMQSLVATKGAEVNRGSLSERNEGMSFGIWVLTYISCMDTAYVRENPPRKIAGYKVQENLHFRYLKFLVIRGVLHQESKDFKDLRGPP